MASAYYLNTIEILSRAQNYREKIGVSKGYAPTVGAGSVVLWFRRPII